MYLPTRLPETEIRADPFSLDSLIAWLRTKDASETYCYYNSGACLIAQYFTACGIAFIGISPCEWFSEDDKHLLPHAFADIALYRPHTFGAALSRATAIRGV